MGRTTTDSVWHEWRDGGIENGKRYTTCCHCGHHLQVNVTSFKHHIVQNCIQAPRELKEKYKDIVVKQSLSSETQKRKFACSDIDGFDTGNNIPKWFLAANTDNESDIDDNDNTKIQLLPLPVLPQSSQPQQLQSDFVSLQQDASTTRDKISAEYKTNNNDAIPVPASRSRNVFHGFFDAMSSVEQFELDCLFAQAVYTNGWSFSSTSNPYFRNFLTKLGPSYHQPSEYQLAGKLLEVTASKVDKIVGDALSTAPNITIQVDGWSDINRTSLVNAAVFTGRPVFLKSIDPGAQRHDTDFITKTILDVVGGNKKYRSVVTDQPSVMTSVWQKVSDSAPWVNCYGCGGHMNLLAGDFCKIEVVHDVMENNRKFAKFFNPFTSNREYTRGLTSQLYTKRGFTRLRKN